MNQDQVLSLVRWALTAVGPTVLATGVVPANVWTGATAIITSLVPVVWGLFAHTDAAKLVSAAAVPGIEPIKVLPTAPASVQAVAADSKVPGVIPARGFTS